jgi:hypothetical protein
MRDAMPNPDNRPTLDPSDDRFRGLIPDGWARFAHEPDGSFLARMAWEWKRRVTTPECDGPETSPYYNVSGMAAGIVRLREAVSEAIRLLEAAPDRRPSPQLLEARITLHAALKPENEDYV